MNSYEETIHGPGKYGNEAEFIQELTQAKTVLLMILDGNKGPGFSVITKNPEVRFHIPSMLRRMADELQKSIDAAKQS